MQNQYSWTNLSTIIYIDQPVGAGFSQGTPSIKNEEDLSAQLAGFLEQFLDVFEELRGKKFCISGESVRTTFFLLSVYFLIMDWSMQERTYLVSKKNEFFYYYYDRYLLDFANYIYDHPGLLDLDFQGMWISDRALIGFISEYYLTYSI